MVKKILFVFAALILLIIAAGIVLPIIFKDDIFKMAEEEANKNLNATVEIGDLGLSIFESFPDFTLTIEEVRVQGVDQFEGLVLADIKELKLSLDLMSVIGGERIQINTIGLNSPKIHVLVLANGTANYDITIPSDEVAVEDEDTTEESSGFNIGLSEYYIRNAQVIYDDRAGGMYAELVNFTHEGSGDFTQDDFLLKTLTTADEVTYKMDGVAFLNRTELDMTFNVNMNLPNMKFQFDENSVRLNALELSFDGMVAMPDEPDSPIDLDLTFATNQTTFGGILSLVPAIYTKDFEDIETSGSLALDGMAKGRLVGDQLPAFALDLTVADASFHYPELPKSAENIAVDLHIKNPGGSDDNTIIDLNTFHVELANNPVDVQLHMRTPISDPFIDANIQANLDLASVADVVPLEEGQALTGKVVSDVKLKGNQSALDQGRYQDFEAGGSLALSNIDYKDPELAYATIIEVCSLNFSPRFAELTAFTMQIGQSDMSLTGRVDNIVEWYVADAPLSGTFNLSSNSLDLNEFAGEETEEVDEPSSGESTEEESTGVIEVPAGYDFTLNTAIKKLVYENLVITSVRGSVALEDHKVSMRNLAMDLLEGSMTMSGYYETANPAQPSFDFDMDIIGWDVVATYTYLEMVQKMAPIMENATGRFSTEVELFGDLDNNMEPIYSSLNGGGVLITRGVSINSPKALAKASDAIKYDGIKEFTLDDTEVEYYFEDGRVVVDPAEFTIGKEIPSVFGGSHGFDQTLDYTLKLDVPTKLMGGAATQVLGGLMNQANQALGTNASMPERVKVDLAIGGTSDEPEVTPSIEGSEGKSAGEQVKDKAKAELDKQKRELERKAKREAERAKKQAQRQADQAKQQAQEQADAAKKKAEEEAKKAEEELKRKAEEEKRKAEEEAKKKAEEEAKKNLNKLFK